MKKQSIFKILLFFSITMAIICCGLGILNVQAASKTTQYKAAYTIKRYSARYKGSNGRVSAKYVYELPQLRGNSAFVRKANASLKKAYRQSLNGKKGAFETAEYSDKNLTYKDKYFTTTTCKVTYNKKGFVSFRFHHRWYIGGVCNIWTNGVTYNLKTGKKVNVTNVISGNKKTVRNKIINKYFTKFELRSEDEYTAMLNLDVQKSDFYLENGNVIVCFGPYLPAGGNASRKISLKGNYQ